MAADDQTLDAVDLGTPNDADLVYLLSGGTVDKSATLGSFKTSWLDGVAPQLSLITDGLFHIAADSAGGITAAGGADELVLENSVAVGLSLLTSATGFSSISIGEPGNNQIGNQVFNHNLTNWTWDMAGTQRVKYTLTETVFNEQAADLDFRVESDLNTHMLHVDAGNNSVHIDNSVLTGAGDGDLVMANNKSFRWLQSGGTTSADLRIWAGASDGINMQVPAATDLFNFWWSGSNSISMKSENSGAGVLFSGESSLDHSAPAANGAVLYTKDNGGGKTQLAVRFATGAVQILATEP